MLMGWNCVEWLSPKGSRFVIYHRDGEADWVPKAVQYVSDSLPDLVPVQSSRFAVVQRCGGWYLKRYLIRGWRDVLKNLVRPSRARRALRNGEFLTSLKIHTPRAACLIEEYRWGWLHESRLVTAAVDHAPALTEWLNRPELGVSQDRAEKRRLLIAFAREVARWHNLGLHHADMRLGNVLCRRERLDWEFHWLDNEGNSRHARLPNSERVHNLMQVNMERTGVRWTDRICFWREYIAACGIEREPARKIQHDVMAYTRRRWEKNGWLSSNA